MIKVKKRKILLLPGDGIGPEVIGEVRKIINWFNDKKSLDFETDKEILDNKLGNILVYETPNSKLKREIERDKNFESDSKMEASLFF